MKIVIVGAGTGGSNIITSFLNTKDIDIVLVIDRNQNSKGILMAKEVGLAYSDSIDDINPSYTDIIIEATGNENVSKILREKFENHCTILDSKAALLLMTLVKKDIEDFENMNKQMVFLIDNISSIVEEEMREIFSSVENINIIINNLLSSAENSSEYIEKTDNIVKYVNEISSKTKMLGLNASIEAARAAEHGKSFSVVAKEIQKLAGDSTSFAKEIKSILEKLQDETKNIHEEIKKLDTLSQKQVGASNNVTDAILKLKKESAI